MPHRHIVSIVLLALLAGSVVQADALHPKNWTQATARPSNPEDTYPPFSRIHFIERADKPALGRQPEHLRNTGSTGAAMDGRPWTFGLSQRGVTLLRRF